MRQRSLSFRALHEHLNRYPDTLIDVDHDNFFLIAKKNRDAAACRRHCADLYFDNRLAHVASLGSHVASGYRILRPGQNRGTLLGTSLELWDRHFNTNARRQFHEELAPSARAGLTRPWPTSLVSATRFVLE